MYRQKILFFLVFTCVMGLRSQEQFQYSAEVEEQFVKATALFAGKRYDDAALLFDTLSHMKPFHQRTTAAKVMEAKSFFELKQFDRSVVVLDEFIKQFSLSSYLDDARYMLGLNLMMQQRHKDAAREFLRSMEIANDSISSAKAEELFSSLARKRLSIRDLESLLQEIPSERLKDFVGLMLAEKYFAQGDIVHAQSVLDHRMIGEDVNVYTRQIQTLRKQLTQETAVKVGVMFPLQTNSAPSAISIIASEMKDGITFALRDAKTRTRNGIAIGIEVRDTDRDSLKAIQAVKEFAAEKEIIGIIGPLFSNIAQVCAPVANEAHVPLISPTATANGIAKTGQYVFQTHPDHDTRGRAMALYAVQQLGYKTFAVLTSDEPMGRFVAESFVAEARNLGATVVIVQSYAKGISDLHEQCMNIRKAATHEELQVFFTGKLTKSEISRLGNAGADTRLLDSLRTGGGGSISVTRLFGPRGSHIADSLHLKLVDSNASAEDVELPITSLDAIFTAVSDAEEIGVVSSQLRYFNIKAQLLGNNEWYDASSLDANKRYVNGIIFVSDTYTASDDSAFISFVASFKNVIGKAPTKYTVIGYDVMKLILAQHATSREALMTALSSVKDFQGLHSKVTLTHGRVNSEIYVLQYTNGEVKKIGDISIH
jgi:ABC-type branched-subunit amino acid transport system substrate-binding protein